MVSKVLSALALGGGFTPSLIFGLWAASMAWQMCLLLCAAWVGMCHVFEEFVIIWPIKVRLRRGDVGVNVFLRLYEVATSHAACGVALRACRYRCVLPREMGAISMTASPMFTLKTLLLRVRKLARLTVGISLFCLVQALRVALLWSKTVLFIPVVSTTLQLLQCEEKWASTNWKCYTSVHLVITILSFLLLLLYIGFILLGINTLGMGFCSFTHCFLS